MVIDETTRIFLSNLIDKAFDSNMSHSVREALMLELAEDFSAQATVGVRNALPIAKQEEFDALLRRGATAQEQNAFLMAHLSNPNKVFTKIMDDFEREYIGRGNSDDVKSIQGNGQKSSNANSAIFILGLVVSAVVVGVFWYFWSASFAITLAFAFGFYFMIRGLNSWMFRVLKTKAPLALYFALPVLAWLGFFVAGIYGWWFQDEPWWRALGMSFLSHQIASRSYPSDLSS